MSSQESPVQKYAKSFISGGIGGTCSVLTGHPFDLVKVRMQTCPPGTKTSMLLEARKVVSADGLKGFYRGVGPPLIGVTPIYAVSFLGYAWGKQLVTLFRPATTPSSAPLSIPEIAAAGAFSAVPQAFVAAPVERVKVLLQMQGQGAGSVQKYLGPADVVRQLVKEGGVRSVFRGTGATIARDGPGSAVYFLTYEVIKRALTPEQVHGMPSQPPNLLATVVAGGMAGIGMWSVAIPPDVVKSHLQSAPHGTYTGFTHCAKSIVQAGGVRALFKGLSPAMARAFPANAAAFLGVEYSANLLNKIM